MYIYVPIRSKITLEIVTSPPLVMLAKKLFFLSWFPIQQNQFICMPLSCIVLMFPRNKIHEFLTWNVLREKID